MFSRAAETSSAATRRIDFDAEIDELPGLLREHVKAPSVEAGRYDLVIDDIVVHFVHAAAIAACADRVEVSLETVVKAYSVRRP